MNASFHALIDLELVEMSGTAFNGSPWLSAVEIGALVMLSFGGAAVGASLFSAGLQRSMDAELAKEVKKTSRRRRIPVNAAAAIAEEVEELSVLSVVEDASDNGSKPS